ncbi:uncharacterized protein SAMN05428969_1255 [Devosia sp. YR412]|uniref:UPF0149 family protein n=1 Tax=Devosia sp. YR412 TaxID=1881030 RepID=UPI0008B1CB1D|nr:UPF0149 family protein [Devosia sp. YR412]SEP86469.1 uncharacterized protein SAMN05428969_1255 [Devosia sp. YR412]
MDDFEELSESQQRLDAMLTELGDDGMLLSELDGYLCGIAAGPELVAPETFLPLVWGGEDFDVPAVNQAELTSAVMARYEQINTELAEARYEPLYELDEEDGVIWEVWIAGFEAAIGLSFDAWEKLLQSHKESQAQEAAFGIMSLLAASDPAISDEDAKDPEMIKLQQDAPHLIPEIVGTLYRAHRLATPQTPIRSDAVGRNDPCPCGSGLKYKKCHGAS